MSAPASTFTPSATASCTSRRSSSSATTAWQALYDIANHLHNGVAAVAMRHTVPRCLIRGATSRAVDDRLKVSSGCWRGRACCMMVRGCQAQVCPIEHIHHLHAAVLAVCACRGTKVDTSASLWAVWRGAINEKRGSRGAHSVSLYCFSLEGLQARLYMAG